MWLANIIFTLWYRDDYGFLFFFLSSATASTFKTRRRRSLCVTAVRSFGAPRRRGLRRRVLPITPHRRRRRRNELRRLHYIRPPINNARRLRPARRAFSVSFASDATGPETAYRAGRRQKVITPRRRIPRLRGGEGDGETRTVCVGVIDAMRSVSEAPPRIVSHRRRFLVRLRFPSTSPRAVKSAVRCSDHRRLRSPRKIGFFPKKYTTPSRPSRDYRPRLVRAPNP